MGIQNHNLKKFLPDLIFLGFFTLLNFYPLYQVFFFQEAPFYQNAYDEYSYFNYFYGIKTIGVGRVLIYFSTILHEIGISGGFQNLLFDLAAPIAIYFFSSKIFRNKWAALILTFSPIIFLTTNPTIAIITGQITHHDTLIKYFISPEANFLPISRGPEPQLSIALLTATTYFALKRKKPYLISFILPFLYYYLAVPTFALLLLHYSKKFIKNFSLRILSTWLIVSSSLGIALYILQKNDSFHATTQSHLPFISITFLISILLYLIIKNFLTPSQKSFSKNLLAIPIITLNTQILTGRFVQPNNFEQYAHIFIPILLIALAVSNSNFKKPQHPTPHRQSLAATTLLLTAALIFISTKSIIANNQLDFLHWQKLRATTDITDQVKSSPETVIIDRYILSSKISAFAFPKQKNLVMDYNKTYYSYFEPHFLQIYINAKKFIQDNDISNQAFRNSFKILDNGYTHLNTNFKLIRLNRTPPIPAINDLDSISPKNQNFHVYTTE